MRTKLLLSLLGLWLGLQPAGAQGTAFTYQGWLNDGPGPTPPPATGIYDFKFTLCTVPTAGGAVAGPLLVNDLPVTNGLVMATLDFGAGVFNGTRYWLEIEVRTNDAPAYTTLIPRTELTPTPYAIFAETVASGGLAGTYGNAVSFNNAANSFTGNGGGLTSLNANNISGGTLAEARLPANVARLAVPNTARSAQGTVTRTTGVIVSAAVTDGGAGYLTPPNVFVLAPFGSGAVITANISGGMVVSFNVVNGGAGYTLQPSLVVAPPPPTAQTFSSPNNFLNTVGIGTSVPEDALLDIEGDVHVNDRYVFLRGGSDRNHGFGYASSVAGQSIDGPWLYGYGGGALGTSNPDTVALSWNRDGDVEVSGKITAASFNGAGALPWETVTGTAIQAHPNKGYLLINAEPVDVLLPASPNVGDIVRVSSIGNCGWRLGQNAGQSVLSRHLSPSVVGWAPRGTDQYWSALASSADGSKLIAAAGVNLPVTNGGFLFTSADFGATWTQRESSRAWKDVASSADGTKLVAVVQNGFIYTSTDSGVSWTQRATQRAWFAAASSADGNNLVALNNGGQIYTSTDSGVTWTPRENARNWIDVASSEDGTKLVALVNQGYIYTSTDSGVTWTARATDNFRYWRAVASSADGTRLVATATVTGGGGIYTSTDSGITWTLRYGGDFWISVASSADGCKLIACQIETVYLSGDGGRSWTPSISKPARYWSKVTSSADGTKLAAALFGEKIYTSISGTPINNSLGTPGYLAADRYSAIELQYVGNGQFLPLSHAGTVTPY